MKIFLYCKAQIGFELILMFVAFLFVRDGNRLNRQAKCKMCNKYFDYLFMAGCTAILFDGVTAFTVNCLDTVPALVNLYLHLIYLLAYQIFNFIHFMYWLSKTEALPDTTRKKVLCYLPIMLSVFTTISYIPNITYHIGKFTNYSIGIPAYICYISIVLYFALTLIIFFTRKRYIQKNKRTAYAFALSTVFVTTLTQIIFKETLISSIGIIMVIISIYLCMENPSLKYMDFYYDEMIMGFATLVESKDDSTGGHIKRSSAYVNIIANSLKNLPKYKNIISKDYIDNLNKAAPMHDIGKISIPDEILQKPGKLSYDEMEIIKTHPDIGSKIIRNTFGHLDNQEYQETAYNVARYHHEKWNGKGYPDGLTKEEIPLCARIMAVADVFDAVSANRCYRDAMPLETCFNIISKGRNTDFDPDVVDAFLANRQQIKVIYHNLELNK